jgi:hypothetical protein
VDIEGVILSYDANRDCFSRIDKIPIWDVVSYLKGIYTNKDRFFDRFVEPIKIGLSMTGREDRHANVDLMMEYYDMVDAFTYKEAMEIADPTFRAMVFGSISIEQMLTHLGHKRVAIEGIRVNHRVYSAEYADMEASDGSIMSVVAEDATPTYEMKEFDLVYELYEVDCTELGANDVGYVVKCWCTSTNKEHWLWVRPEYAKKGPLEAIASTCMVWENVLPYITCLKRQGDVFLFETSRHVVPSGEIVSLTAEQYFKLLVSQS